MEVRDQIFDLAIIGGGPAGTASAIAARAKGMQVVIWEQKRFPHDKVCGEFLSEESLHILERLVPMSLGRSAPITRCEFVPRYGQSVSFPLPQPARGLSRECLDHALWKVAAEAGAETWEGVRIHRIVRTPLARPKDPKWQAVTVAGRVTAARSLLLACGRGQSIESLGLSCIRHKPPLDPWMGIKAHFRGLARREAVEMYCFQGGYCGLAPIEDDLYNVCCLIRYKKLREIGETGGGENLSSWLHQAARHPALDARLKNAIQATASVATAPVSPAPYRTIVEDALVAGDAGGFLDPFTGDGISVALHSGLLSAEILAEARTDSLELLSGNNLFREYDRRLSQAVRRSYRVARSLRALADAPDYCQAAAIRLLAWFGQHLVAHTRWRSTRESPVIISREGTLNGPFGHV